MKVLLVEDDPLVRWMAANALREDGFDVIEADCGEKALQRFEEQRADVLFTDINLGGAVSGWDVAENCRRAKPDLPVIYASAMRESSRAVPGSVYFQKPYTIDQIVATVEAACRGRRRSCLSCAIE